MSQTAELRCSCGKVEGQVRDASPDTVNRVICYCDDCQAYAHWLGRPAELLDAHGGSDIVQVAPASLAFTRGSELIVGLRLKPKGLYRRYASCCKTPLGNTVSPAIPFVGIVSTAFAGRADACFGPPIGGILGKFAIGPAPAGSDRANLPLLGRSIWRVFTWRVRGLTWPHPFFDRASGAPRFPITILERADREALRPLCGPRPTAPA